MNELSALAGSERYVACVDDGVWGSAPQKHTAVAVARRPTKSDERSACHPKGEKSAVSVNSRSLP